MPIFWLISDEAGRGPLGDQVLLVAMQVDRDRGLMRVADGPDDVLGPPGGVAAEEHAGTRRHERLLVDLGHVPFAELDADVALDPGERVLLADRHQHVVALEDDLFAGRHELAAAVGAVLGLHLLELDAGELAVLEDEFLGIVVVEDRDRLALGVLDLPGRRLHVLARRAHGDAYVLAAEADGRAAAVHGRVAAADDDDLLADLGRVLEGDRGQPVDADVDVGGGFLAAGDIRDPCRAARRCRRTARRTSRR